MEYRRLGKTGMNVSALGFGSMGLRGPKTWGVRVADDETSRNILNRVLDSGINFIDTSPDYGVAEERIGKFIGHRRDEFYIATKCGCVYQTKGNQLALDHQWTTKVVKSNLETSLSRLNTDRIDLLQFHGGSAKELVDSGLIDLLTLWKEEGKIGAIGVSSKLPELNSLFQLGVFDSFQIPFSCLSAEHLLVMKNISESGAGVVVRGGIGQGGPEAVIQRPENNEVWDRLELHHFLKEMTPPVQEAWRPSDLILSWTLACRWVDTVIVGTANADHLAQNVKLANAMPMSVPLYEKIESRIKSYFFPSESGSAS